jgi:hypothetical protein
MCASIQTYTHAHTYTHIHKTMFYKKKKPIAIMM